MVPPVQTLPHHRENWIRESLPDLAKTVVELRTQVLQALPRRTWVCVSFLIPAKTVAKVPP